MEGVEMETAPPAQYPDEGFCAAVLSQFSKSTNEHHLHICAVIGAMSQELIDQNLPLTPITYFGATCSSLDRLSSSSDPPGHLLDALLTILSLVIDRFSPVVLRTKYVYLSELLIRILGVKSVGVNGVVPGIKCASRLLIAREKVEWADVAQLFGVLTAYVADDRLKPSSLSIDLGGETQIRKQSHTCLCEALEYFQLAPALAPLLAPASEAITNIFERFLLIAGGSNSTVSEGPKAAQEILYILDALKICLPYMSSKYTTNILKYFKSLLELRYPIVTRRIADGLNALCLHSAGEVSAEALLELLCSLTTSISPDESSADSMMFTARLLDTGMKKVYSLNRQICVVKLPVVFNALKDILASEHEEASVAAVASFKSLIQSCIDESLIKQGVDQITVNADATTRKTGPTVIEKVCATIESLLDYHYEPVWDMSFQIASTLFDKLGKYSSYFLEETLKSLADMQKLPDEDFALRKQLHECMGKALGAMETETFLSLLPLNLEAQDLSESNLWLFPILKQYTVGAHLNFFTKSILPMIREMKQKSAALEREGKIHSARSIDGIVYSLWSLLPSFCNYPVDTAESFNGLERALCTALQEEPMVRGLICSGLQILIQQNKRILEGKQNSPNIEIGVAEERAIALYTADVAGLNLTTLKSCARELLSVLTGIYSKSSKDTGGILQSTIGELASISDKEVVTWFFKKTMQKLLKVTQEAGKSRNSKDSNSMQVDNSSDEGSLSTARAQLFDLAVSLLPGLNSKEIDLLFIALKPALKDVDGLIQKKAYRALSLLFQDSDDFTSRKFEEVLGLMIEVLPSCHFSAKCHRLNCLYYLIIHATKEGSEKRRHDITASFLTEIVLALKEANKKTRNRAYDILVQIGHACEDVEKGGDEKLLQFFNMVAGGLAGETPHMISAAMTGLARLAYEFSDLVSSAYNVLPSAFLLLQRKNKEIVKANLGLLKVLVAKSQAEGLQTHLRGMVEGLLNWQDGTKNHFKAKVKLLLEMLVKKCGLDAVKEVMPEEHMKLLTNIRKLKDRKEKKHAAKSVDGKSVVSKATTSRISRWNHTKVFSDFDDDETMISDGEFTDAKSIHGRQSKSALQSKASLLRSKKSRKTAKSLEEDAFDQLDNDEPLDLLDRQKTRSALRSSQQLKTKNDYLDDEPFIDSEGRLVIQEDGKSRKADRKHKREQTEEADGRSEAGSHFSANSRKTRKRVKTSESGWAYTGKEYASKKAGGDLKRKDKLEPYAYWPLDRKMMSQRPEHRAAARKGMASVVKLTKRLEGRSVSSALSVKGIALRKGKKKGGQKIN
ncbi:rrp12-like protein [Phtheirospermum japonicum]|uniref:Rrp12-like protein n=1 Tax=Phtheirospermum japonicum TaxID=374723 RepID=A0A830BHZ1_9LAMI|nr:rrp12-like protein [Phtheirospermum japonicum]